MPVLWSGVGRLGALRFSRRGTCRHVCGYLWLLAFTPVGSPLPLGLWAGGTMFVRKVHAPARSCAFVFGRHAHTGAQEVIAGVHLLAPPCRLRSTRAVSPLSGPADVTLPQPCPPFPRQICKEHKDHGVRKEERVEGDASQASWVIRVLDHEHAISCCCYPLESINCSHTQMVTGRNLPTLVQRYVAHPIAQQSVDCTKNRTATGWCYM